MSVRTSCRGLFDDETSSTSRPLTVTTVRWVDEVSAAPFITTVEVEDEADEMSLLFGVRCRDGDELSRLVWNQVFISRDDEMFFLNCLELMNMQNTHIIRFVFTNKVDKVSQPYQGYTRR